MSHTKEPWIVDPDDRPGYEWNNHIISATDPNQTICFMTHDNTPENITGEANAHRIVACVNACDGISTEALEEAGRNGQRVSEMLLKQRDELLTALEGVLPFLTGNYWPGVEADAAVDRAIAVARKVEGHNV